MKTKFDCCLDYLEKSASEVTRAGGLGRLGQLLTGSRARALEERATGVGAAADRVRRTIDASNPSAPRRMMLARAHANEMGAQRAARAATEERDAVRTARGMTAGGLGAAAIGTAAHFQDPPPAPDAPPEKKSPLWEGAKVVGTSLAGFGLGQLAGAGIGRLVERGARSRGIDPVSVAQTAAPIVGGAAGILYPMWRAREQKELTNAVESARDQNERVRLSRQ